MKKKNYMFVLIISIALEIYALPYYLGKEFIHTDEYVKICIDSNAIKFDNLLEKGRLFQKKEFDYFEGDKNFYIFLDCIVSNTYFLTVIKKDSRSDLDYSCWEMTYKERLKDTIYNASKLIPFTLISAESFITEKDKSGNEIKFLPENSDFFSLGSNPWAVKADASKVINVSTKRWRHPTMKYYPISDIVFVNGFVYPDKLHLYEQNSRAKRVKISYADTSFEAELKDTGNFQVVHLPAAIDPKADNDIRLEILDYYPGTKYSDVVISGLYYMDALVK